MSKYKIHRIPALVGLLGALSLGAPALADSATDFFKGKTLIYIVATSPGGGYDTYARLIGKYMEKYLPVSKIIIKNVPGAGHIIGANQLYAAKPDGLTIGTFNTGLVYAQLLEREGIKFDLAKMTYLGKAAADPRLIVVSTKSDIKSFADLRNAAEPVNFAAAGPGSSAYNEIKMLNNALNLNIKIITGYRGQEGEMAIMRGEVVGQMASRSSMAPFIKNGFGRAILQIGGTSDPDLKVPLAADVITEGRGAALVALIASQAELARLTGAPPGVPAERAKVLVAAYRSALEDPEFLSQAKKIGRPIDPLYGEAVAKRISQALNQSPETVALVTAVLREKPGGLEVKDASIAVLDGGRWIEFKGADGNMMKSKISSSRTKLTIGGKEAKRKKLLAGMTCDITYVVDGDRNEPSVVSCQ